MQVKYGLLDIVDNCWIGDHHGPRLFDEFWIARVAAQVADVMVGNKPGTIMAAPYIEYKLKLKDEVAVKMDSRTALKMLKEGKA